MAPSITDRSAITWRGALRGALGGLIWSLPVGVALAAVFWNDPKAGGLPGAFPIVGWTVGVWVAIAAFVGASQGFERTLPDESRSAVERHIRRAAIQATCFSTPVVLFLVAGTWGYSPIGALLNGSFLMGIWVGSAALVGRAKGMKEVRRAEDEARNQALRLDAERFASQRAELERALETRFGQLNDAARRRFVAWDHDRIAEATRRLAEAKSLAELGLDEDS